MTLSISSLTKNTVGAAFLSLTSVYLVSCGHQSGGTIEVYETVGYQPHFGPFDHNGNYVDKWADNPPKRKYIPRDQKKSKSQPQKPQPQYVSNTPPTPKPTYTPPKASPPKTVTVISKKKSPITHTVKRGDTLYGLSRKYGTSVSSIQRANKLRGTTINIGQRLIIPR